MKTQYKPLFTPWKINNCEIKNRIVLTSMGGTNLLGWMERPHFDKAGAEFIYEVAKNNVGLLLPGCQPIYNPIGGNWLYQNKQMYRDLANWMPKFHETGAKLFVQLTAGFGRSFTISPLMEKLYTNPILRKISKPFMDLDKITATASESPNRWSDKVPSRALTIEEIEEYIQAFAKTAQLLQAAGVDGVEIHAVHEGYLLDQFTLKYINKRTDKYGGGLENRYRFATDIVKAIKNVCGKDFPVSLRYSVVSKTKDFRKGALPDEKYKEVGRDMKESEQAAKLLQDAGYDMLNCDNGTYDAWYWAHPPIYMPENCNLTDVEHIKKFVDIPVVAAGRIDPTTAAKSISKGNLDGAGFARQFLADQKWVTKLMENREEDIRPCILCHNGCFNMAHYNGVPNDQSLYDSLHLARCAVNARTMQTDKHYIKKTQNPKDVAIIGGGIAGMETALVLKARGHNPTIYEKTNKLGGVFIAGSSESYKGKLRELLEWYKKQLKKNNISVNVKREVKSVDNFDCPVIIATGSTPIKINSIPGFDKTIEAIDFLNKLTENNKKRAQKSDKKVSDKKTSGIKSISEKKVSSKKEKIAIIGGGLTGCEIAYELELLGYKPIIIEMKDDLVAQTGVCLANSSYLREYFELKKVPVYLKTTLKAVKDKYIECEKDGEIIKIDCDKVVASIGYKPAPLTKKSKNVHLVGDCHKVGNLRTVIWRAWDVAMKI